MLIILFSFGLISSLNVSKFFQNKLNPVIRNGYIRLIFDMTMVSYVSSTGIGSFTGFMKTLTPSGGKIVFFAMQPKVLDVFQLLGFTSFFTFCDTMENAESTVLQSQPVQAVFPKMFNCPICSKHLKSTKAGRFRCPECKTIIAVNEKGMIFLG